MKMGLERGLKEKIPEIQEVIQVRWWGFLDDGLEYGRSALTLLRTLGQSTRTRCYK